MSTIAKFECRCNFEKFTPLFLFQNSKAIKFPHFPSTIVSAQLPRTMGERPPRWIKVDCIVGDGWVRKCQTTLVDHDHLIVFVNLSSASFRCSRVFMYLSIFCVLILKFSFVDWTLRQKAHDAFYTFGPVDSPSVFGVDSR